MSTETSFDKRAAKVKTLLTAHKGTLPKVDATDAVMLAKDAKDAIVSDMRQAVQELNSIRSGSNDVRGIDLSFGQFVAEKWGFGTGERGENLDGFYISLGIQPSQHTVQRLLNMPEMPEGYRWLVPEIVREAVRLGLRRAPIYTGLIAAEETVTQPTVIMPSVNVSSANVSRIGETETIPTGNVSFGQKTVKLHKVGTGLKVSDEVQNFVSLNLLSLYLQDVGLNIGNALDSLAIDTLINGEQADNSESAAVIGVDNTTNGIVYKDILRAWIRMGRLGRTPDSMLSGETAALKILLLDEFKGIYAGQNKLVNINFRTPIPQTQNYYVHGAAPSTEKLILIDTTSALIKLNVGSMKVESERIAERQLSGTYVTMMTGFSTLFRDARLILDAAQAFSSVGFPPWMDINTFENNTSLQ